MFELAEEPKNDVSYELIKYSKIRNESAPIGDMLSRLWGHFGKPQSILFEGYIYYLKDKTTGLNFIVSFGASGPVYLADKKDVDKLRPAIESFEKFLDTSYNADCEIEVDTDFGIYLCGAKDGSAYDRETSVYNTNPSEDERLITLISDLRVSLENNLQDSSPALKQKDIDECIDILSNYSINLGKIHSREEVLPILKSTIQQLNKLNKKYNYSLIETVEKKLISQIMVILGNKKGYNDLEKNITEEWTAG